MFDTWAMWACGYTGTTFFIALAVFIAGLIAVGVFGRNLDKDDKGWLYVADFLICAAVWITFIISGGIMSTTHYAPTQWMQHLPSQESSYLKGKMLKTGKPMDIQEFINWTYAYDAKHQSKNVMQEQAKILS